MFKVQIGEKAFIDLRSLSNGAAHFAIGVEHKLLGKKVQMSFSESGLVEFRERLMELWKEGYHIPLWLQWLVDCVIILEGESGDRDDETIWLLHDIVAKYGVRPGTDWLSDFIFDQDLSPSLKRAIKEERITEGQAELIVRSFGIYESGWYFKEGHQSARRQMMADALRSKIGASHAQ